MAINHKAAKEFAKRWSGKKWSEDQHARTFWMDLLESVFDIDYTDTNNVIFEYRTSASGKIDLWLRNLSTMIEMKSSDVDLDKPEPRQGELKTPFKQVYDYAVSFPRNEQPDYLITCNFNRFRVYSRKEYGDIDLENKALEFTIDELGNKPEYLAFLVDPNNSRLYRERKISETAGQLVGDLYKMLHKQYIDPESDAAQHSLNVLCVRLVFCLFCEDAGLFGEMDAFYNYLKDVPSNNIRLNLQRLFNALDTPLSDRDPYDTQLKMFPYVNGGLFRDEVEIPSFSDEIKDFLLTDLSRGVDWSKISPTIFGGMFESTLNPETRRTGGMHYTSPEDIHKVIDPLFLDDLKDEFMSIVEDESLSVIRKRNQLRKFHHKICTLKFLDPAAGSGNFLTETYICLRELELSIIRELNRGKTIGMFDSAIEGEIVERVKLSQFFGIEINDFAVAVAETALWISRLKENQVAIVAYDFDEVDFPLDDRANIICENALSFDWKDLIEPSELSYIMGNPPFVGTKMMKKPQKEDTKRILGHLNKYGTLDYVCCWFVKAAEYTYNTNIRCAFVATNSICQGEQVAVLWEPLMTLGVKINFAYRTFEWTSETVDAAHIHCIIVGFSYNFGCNKIFDADRCIIANNINPYLVDAENVFIQSVKKPLCSVPQMYIGIDYKDDGLYIMDEEEKNRIVEMNPGIDEFIRPYMSGKDFIERKPRYCFWFKNHSREEYERYPEIVRRIESVRLFRENCDSPDTQKFANKPTEPTRYRYYNTDWNTDALALPMVSSQRRHYIPIDVLSSETIATVMVLLIPDMSLWQFGVLTSSVHMSWMRTVAGRLKSDYRYSNNLVYNTFPWPNPTEDMKERIALSAKDILDARNCYPEKPLSELYDPEKMPSNLKEAHESNDRAVMAAYGFSFDMTESEIVSQLMNMYQELTRNGEKEE